MKRLMLLPSYEGVRLIILRIGEAAAKLDGAEFVVSGECSGAAGDTP